MTGFGRRLRKLASRVLPSSPGAVILGYHRVADPDGIAGGDPYSLCVSPESFRDQMAVLRDLGRPVSLDTLCDALERREPVLGMIAVTFDDAYEDVLASALPSLEEFAVPATVYFVGDDPGGIFWWDILNDMLGRVDPRGPFRIAAGGSELSWGGGSMDRLQDTLHRSLRILEGPDRLDALDQLAAVWEVRPSADLPRSLDREGGRQLAASPLIQAGVHTLSHPALAEIPAERAHREISDARSVLAERLGVDLHTFSYPHGSLDETSRRIVMEAGYSSACAAHQGAVRPGADRFALPRAWVPDSPSPAFRRRVRAYTGRGARTNEGGA